MAESPDGLRQAPPDRVACRYHGRDFTADEMRRLRRLIARRPARNRAQLSREFCELIGWRRPDGGLKDMAARVAMLAMHRDGWIVLPPPRRRRYPPKPANPQLSQPPLLSPPTALKDAQPLTLTPISARDRKASDYWNANIAAHHYLGYTSQTGAQMRYIVHDRNGEPLALLGFAAAAWKLAPRDRFIGWSPRTRERHLPRIVNNTRLLVLPWVRLPNLVSHLFKRLAQQLPDDWQRRYRITPVLIETFVETPRFSGTAYQASGWLHIGTTQGRGRQDAHKQYPVPKKHIWLKPLRKDWKRLLNRENTHPSNTR